jgi:multidrug resistance protein, MATE family
LSLKRPILRDLVLLAWPVVLSQLGHVMVGVADSVMIGNTGTIPLAASSFANSLFVILLVFGIGVSFGLTPLVAEADGGKNKQRLSLLLGNGLMVNSLVSLVLVALLFMGIPFMDFLGQDSEVLDLAKPYLKIITLSVIPLMVFLALKQFAEGLSDTKMAMIITIGANLLNVLLNYLFIFGKGGFPEMKLLGAGYATLISRVIMAIAMFIYIARSSRFKEFVGGLSFHKYNKTMVLRILKIGVPSGLQYIFEVGAFAIAAVLIGTIGPVPLAAHQIAISLASVSYMAASGIAAAATVRIGNERGRKNFAAIRQTGDAALFLSIALMTFAGLVLFFGRYLLPSFYTDEAAVLGLSTSLLIVAVVFQISDGLQVVGLGMLRGLSDVKLPTAITFFSYWIVSLPLCWFTGIYLQGGVLSIWISLAAGLTLAAVLLVWRFRVLTKWVAIAEV